MDLQSPEADGITLAQAIFAPVANIGSAPDPHALRALFNPFKLLSLLGWLFNKTVELLCASNTNYDDTFSQRMADGIPRLLTVCPYASPVFANIVFREYRASARDEISRVKSFLAEIVSGLPSTLALPPAAQSANEVVISKHLGPLLEAFPSLREKDSWALLLRSGYCEAHSLDPESFALPASFSKFRSFDIFVDAMMHTFLNSRRIDPLFWSHARRFATTALPLSYTRTVILVRSRLFLAF